MAAAASHRGKPARWPSSSRNAQVGHARLGCTPISVDSQSLKRSRGRSGNCCCCSRRGPNATWIGQITLRAVGHRLKGMVLINVPPPIVDMLSLVSAIQCVLVTAITRNFCQTTPRVSKNAFVLHRFTELSGQPQKRSHRPVAWIAAHRN